MKKLEILCLLNLQKHKGENSRWKHKQEEEAKIEQTITQG